MQSLQQTNPNLPPEYGYLNCSYQSVEELLNHCHLGHYIETFISEGFDSITSLLEITEEDMTVMNVKRGHRRLIQREIATIKGIPRHQLLNVNMLGSMSLGSEIKLKSEELRPSPNFNTVIRSNPTYNNSGNKIPSNYSSGCTNPIGHLPNYDTTGLTSPKSMNSGVGSSSGGDNTGLNIMSKMQLDNCNNLIHPMSNPMLMIQQPHSDNNANVEIQSISSNDDSIDTNESVPNKRKYRRHAKPDRNAPVKPPSAYIMFSNDARAELKNQNLPFARVAKIVGDQWKHLSHAKKQEYERMAMKAKDEYLAALELYRHTENYKRYKEYLEDFKSKKKDPMSSRKRSKQASPGSGSVADNSSNGMISTGNGSSGSSGDAYTEKETENRSSNQQSSSDSGYTSQSYYRSNWDPRHTNPMMRGMLPIEFVQNVTPSSSFLNKKSDNDYNEQESSKRRSPRFNS